MATHAGELTTAVRTVALRRSFGDRDVLAGIDLEIIRGEFVALIGRSGSGKSTLLRAVAGLDDSVAGSGEVWVPKRVSLVFQDARLLPWLRVLENIVLGQTGAGIKERGRQVLAEVGLGGRERAWPHELSGGEQQRVALARSLVSEPQLLLADEPLGALDALTRIRMHGLLRTLLRVHGPAVLLVTHDVDEALLLADRVLVIEDGRFSLDLHIDLPAKRNAAHPHFVRYRELLLASLGVDIDAATPSLDDSQEIS
ncbi:ABC transporter ATP-binding protein [Micromonospora sp. DT81.3]|uniref:ABC transporter ATP-binding protein n=1 Tax=Micromonospora sp. DT81.3 TaxID=3416523 RepID=UPI003CFB5046